MAITKTEQISLVRTKSDIFKKILCENNHDNALCGKGDLISESFSFWVQTKKCQITHLNKSFQRVIGHLF